MMKSFADKRTYAEIYLDNIIHNIDYVQHVTSNSEIMAVVKANAYGHGANVVAKHIENNVKCFAVSNLVEAVNLRRSGIDKPILILGYTPMEFAHDLSSYRITQTVFSTEYAIALAECARIGGDSVDVQIKIDSGMSRLGIKSLDDALGVYRLKGLNVVGIFTHFSTADSKEEDAIGHYESQRLFFDSLLDGIARSGEDTGAVHTDNSAAALKQNFKRYNLIRYGIAMYGLSPDNDETHTPYLKEAMSLKTTVSMVKKAKGGEKVSYGATYTANSGDYLVTVTIGYADGYPRILSNRGLMYVDGREMRVAGRVCMDQIILLSAYEAAMGDRVDIFGYNTPQSISAFARSAHTINYESVCAVSQRVPRIYYQNGKVVKVVDATP